VRPNGCAGCVPRTTGGARTARACCRRLSSGKSLRPWCASSLARDVMSRANARSSARVTSVVQWRDQSIVVANRANAWRSVCSAARSMARSSGGWGASSTDSDGKDTGLFLHIAARLWRSASAYQSGSGEDLFGPRVPLHPRAQDKTASCPFCKSCASAPWECRAPARLQKPRWSVALPGKTLENWWYVYETNI
jgi:hypothetical protein